MNGKPASRHSKHILWLVVAVAALPFAIGFGLHLSGWRPPATANYGELVQPLLPLPEQGLLRPDGRALATAELRGKWLLVLASDAPCEAVCRQRLYEARQIHESLSKNARRVGRLWLSADPAAEPLLLGLSAAYPDLVVAAPAVGQPGDAWRQIFRSRGPRLFVVDPLGNVVLRYPLAAKPDGVRRDVERLLKFSWVG